MMQVPSDIHAQIVDSYTRLPITTGMPPASTTYEQPTFKQRLRSDSQLRPGRPTNVRERLRLLEARRLRALAKTAELERSMSAQRIEISRWSNHLRQERKKIAKDVDEVRVLGTEHVRWQLYREVQERIENCDARQRICDFMQQPYVEEEQAFCQLVEEMKQKYPTYQIRSTNTIAEAIDNLVCTAEVFLEDSHLVKSTISRTQQRIDELADRNDELAFQIQQVEAMLPVHLSCQRFAATDPQAEPRQAQSPRASPISLSEDDGTGSDDDIVDPALRARRAREHESARRNVLNLTLESVRRRQYDPTD